jgi:hypothetical protein
MHIFICISRKFIFKGKNTARVFDTSALGWVCAGMLGERGLGLVAHIPSGCVAKINIP